MVTVVIPVYNAEKTIERSLNSVKNQTAINKISSIIVINDGSTDTSEEVIKNYMLKNSDLPIEYIFQENAGAAMARNCGLRHVKTKYIAFLDADDIWLPNKLERQLEIIAENPQIRFLGTNWKEEPLQIGFRKITSLYNGCVKDVCIKNFPVTPSVLMETTFLDEVGYFDAARRYAEDINYFQKIAALGNYYFLPEKLVEIDVGKRFFAETGLSAHLLEMHLGTLKNIKELRKDGDISYWFWFKMRVFYELKFYRRIVHKYLLKR